MKTLEVMCIELHRTIPSVTPLLRTASATCGVMLTNAILEGTLSVRYSVWDFMRSSCRQWPDPSRSAGSARSESSIVLAAYPDERRAVVLRGTCLIYPFE